MSVSQALENSAMAFNTKYACNFNFATFEARVEEFTFLRVIGGWVDVYKMTFDRVYKKALESASVGKLYNLNGETMLDDFEYTLIRPYANEFNHDIKHKPYVGMDRITRLEYLDKLTKEAPQNPVELYSEKYKNGELTLKQMKSTKDFKDAEREQCIEIAGYVQALENVNKSRSTIWRALHPFKDNAEKRDAEMMKKSLIEKVCGGEDVYREFAEAACRTFDGHRKANENLSASIVRAKEEMNRLQKINDVRREALHIDSFDKEPKGEVSPRVDQNITPTQKKRI